MVQQALSFGSFQRCLKLADLQTATRQYRISRAGTGHVNVQFYIGKVFAQALPSDNCLVKPRTIMLTGKKRVTTPAQAPALPQAFVPNTVLSQNWYLQAFW